MKLPCGKETTFWIIPPNVYHEIMEDSAVLANYTSQIMATRFSEVMWLVEQIMWKSMDKRLADFLIEESNLEGSESLKITHEKILRFVQYDNCFLFQATATWFDLLEEVITLIINEDECREVLNLNLPNSFHAKLGILDTLNTLDVVLREDSSRTTD